MKATLFFKIYNSQTIITNMLNGKYRFLLNKVKEKIENIFSFLFLNPI